jgi:HEAT repeat protein
LIAALKDSDAGVRVSAAEGLGPLKDPRAIEPLIAAFNETGDSRHDYVVSSLFQIGVPAVDPLIAALKDPSPAVRLGAATALGAIHDPRSMEPLFVSLRDPDAKVRAEVASTLVLFNDSRSVEPLIAALKDQDAEVREWAAWALGPRCDPRGVEPLIALLKDPNAKVRKRAVAALGEAKDPRAVDPLVTLLNDPDLKVRASAVTALGAIKDPRAFAPIFNLLRNQDQLPRAQDQLLQALDSEAQIQMAAALCNIDAVRAVEELLALLKSPDIALRNDAAWALGTCKDARTIDPLIATLNDAGPRVRRGAVVSLAQCKDIRSVEPLIGALKDPDNIVQAYAAMALGQSGDPRAVAPLIALLKAPDSNEWSPVGGSLAEVAIGALGQTEDPRAVRVLIASLKDGSLASLYGSLYDRRQIANALSKMKNHSAMRFLNEALKQHDTDVIAGAYPYFIRLGKAGSEDALIAALNTSGDELMARNFQQCGNAKLAKAGNEWSEELHPFSVIAVTESQGIQWGTARKWAKLNRNPKDQHTTFYL